MFLIRKVSLLPQLFSDFVHNYPKHLLQRVVVFVHTLITLLQGPCKKHRLFWISATSLQSKWYSQFFHKWGRQSNDKIFYTRYIVIRFDFILIGILLIPNQSLNNSPINSKQLSYLKTPEINSSTSLGEKMKASMHLSEKTNLFHAKSRILV